MNTWKAELWTPAGSLWIAGNTRLISAISWEELCFPEQHGELSWFLKDLEAYLAKKSNTFPGGLVFADKKPLWSRGPSQAVLHMFHQQALAAVAGIPYGQTKSYGELARELGNRYYARAIGRVCAMNPLPVVIPCHRVLGCDSLGGYHGGLDKKRFLLALEGAIDTSVKTGISQTT